MCFFIQKKYILVILFLLYHCTAHKHNTPVKVMDVFKQLKNTNLTIFKNIHIESRLYRDYKHVAFSFSKTLNGKVYAIPNFFYPSIYATYACDVENYALQHGIKNELKAYNFVQNYSSTVISEYEKTGVYAIQHNSNLGDIIIFYLDNENYIAYAPDTSKIYNKFWKRCLTSSKRINDVWYTGEY